MERVLEKVFFRIVYHMQFGFLPEKGTIDAVLILRRLQKEYMLYMCFVDLEKAFIRVPRKMVELAMRKKGIPDILV